MDNRYDQPSLEISPEQHDAEAIEPGSTQRDYQRLLSHWRTAPPGPALICCCGTGRHVRALAQAGRDLTGVDLDPRMIAKAREHDPGAPAERYQVHDLASLQLPQRFALITLLGRSLVCFHSHRLAWGLFQGLAKHLLPGGRLLIDDCWTPLWEEIRAGNLAEGLSPDAQSQILFVPGDNRFAWRRGQQVDPDNWELGPQDRLYRIWSLSELRLAAAGVGLEPACLPPQDGLLCLTNAPDAASSCVRR